jgi:hypothetical protein
MDPRDDLAIEDGDIVDVVIEDIIEGFQLDR